MNNILSVNDESVILNIFKDIPYQPVHEHTVTKNIPNNFRSIKRITPEISSSGLYRFTLPEQGFLQGMCLSFTCTSYDNTAEDKVATRIFNSIYLKQGLRDIFHNGPSYSLARLNQEPVQRQNNFTELSNWSQMFDNNEISCSLPIFSSFTDNEKNYLLLNYFRRLELHCQLNQNVITDESIVGLNVELIVFIKNYEDEYYNSFIYKEFLLNKKSKKNYFSYDIFNIQRTLEVGSTETQIILHGPLLVFALHSIIFDTTHANIPIYKLILNHQGTDVLNIKTSENALLDPSYYQYNGNSLSYFFGHKSRDYHSGAINLNNGPWIITLHHNEITETSILNIDLEYFCILESDLNGLFEKNILY